MISIITATYNSAATLGDTIRSVLSQSYTDWEHLIIDGGSTDGTVALAESYRDRYGDRLRIVTGHDSGIYDAMNKGIALAEGNIIGLLNSDDFFSSPDILAAIAEAIGLDAGQSEVEAVYGDVVYVSRDDTSKIVRRYSSRGFRRWKMRIGLMPAHPSFYCRRSVYDRCGLFDLDMRIAADFEHLLRVVYVNRVNCRYLPLNFVTMRSGGASSSGLGSHRQIRRDHLLAYRKNGLRGGSLLDPLRYPAKIIDLLMARLPGLHR